MGNQPINTKNNLFYILCFLIILIISLNIFLVFACQCSMLFSMSNVSNLLKMVTFLFQPILVAIFVSSPGLKAQGELL